MSSLILTIDLGTTSCKLALCDREGTLVACHREEIPLFHPQPLWAEADPQTWWSILVRSIPILLQRADVSPEAIAGIGLCGLMHALVPVSPDGHPLARSMLWMDQRCAPECEWLIRNHGDRIRELTGGFPRTTTSAAKLCWIQRHAPALVRQTHQFLLPKDFLRLKLTGEWATDPSDAGGTGLLSRESRERWADAYLDEILGVPATKLPLIQPSTQIAGQVTPEAASAIGLCPGIPVVTGSSDVQATVLGANLFVPDRLCLYMGTAAWLALGQSPESDQLRIRFLGATATFGAAVRWCVQNLCEGGSTDDSYTEFERAASQIPPGAGGLLCLPHLMGERSPYMSPGATGVFFGVTLSHRRSHFFRAVLEGTACQIRHILDERGWPAVPELWCVGGGTQSPLWLQILGDVLQKPIVVPKVSEAGLLGSAMMAAVGIGWFPDLKTAADAWVHPHRKRDPHPEPAYERTYARYRQLDETLRPFFDPPPEKPDSS